MIKAIFEQQEGPVQLGTTLSIARTMFNAIEYSLDDCEYSLMGSFA